MGLVGRKAGFRIRFCPKGHDTNAVGRYPGNRTCIQCMRDRYSRDLEANRARMRKHYRDNRSERIAHVMNYYREHKAQIVKRIREWANDNRERVRANAARWRKNNRDKCQIKLIRYRARLSSAPGRFSIYEWRDLLKRNTACLMCLRPWGPQLKPTVDHIIPLSRGGSNFIVNIQPLCLSCNSAKKDKLEVSWT